MADFQQLELFDLQNYTVQQQPAATPIKVAQIQKKHQNADFKQIEPQTYSKKNY